MNPTIKEFQSSNDTVTKFVFEFEGAIAEAVLYQYKDRTVICCSVQSGCPVGCTFCGTGKKFVRNLTEAEIRYQIDQILDRKEIDSGQGRFQIMFMSMGEPFLNYKQVDHAIWNLNATFPNAELLVYTIGIDVSEPWMEFLQTSFDIPQVGLQFSIHHADEFERNEMIPYKNKWDLRTIRDRGTQWFYRTGRPVFLNYFVMPGENDTIEHIARLKDLFSPEIFFFTFSVVCDTEKCNGSGIADYERMKILQGYFSEYNTRIFDPDGQDDIGGGCGQLWYVQDWLAEKEGMEKHVMNPSKLWGMNAESTTLPDMSDEEKYRQGISNKVHEKLRRKHE